MREEDVNSRKFTALNLLAGIAYFTAGIFQIVSDYIGIYLPFIPTNPIVGIVLICISSIFLTGAIHTLRGQRDAYAFMIVGMILAAIVFILQIITILTNGLGWLIQLEDWHDWTIQNDLSPGLWLFPIFAVILRILRGEKGSLFHISLSAIGGN
jgi:hypothetical protein